MNKRTARLKKMNIVAIIPARGGSKGIPGKNVMKFCGKPLFLWSVEQALASRYIRRVHVSSDDEKILRLARKAGATAVRRPERLATDTAGVEDAMLHVLDQIEGGNGPEIELVVFLQPTSPVRAPRDIDDALETFIAKKTDSLFSGTVLEDFCVWKKQGPVFKSVTYDYKNRGRRQERQPHFLENGSIYVFRPGILRRYHNRLGGRIVFYPMPFWKSFELDEPGDIDICETFMRKLLKEK